MSLTYEELRELYDDVLHDFDESLASIARALGLPDVYEDGVHCPGVPEILDAIRILRGGRPSGAGDHE
jgi:hypothetical protein